MESNFSNNQDPRKNERVTGHDLKLVEDLMKSLAQIEYECYKNQLSQNTINYERNIIQESKHR